MSVGALQVRVFLAGRVAVEIGRVVIDERRFPGRQGRLLFAYLVTGHGRPVARDELAEALWGDSPPATRDKALTVLASKLRGLLAEAGLDAATTLTSSFGCYRLELPEGTWIDVLAAADAAGSAEEALACGDTAAAKREAMLAESLARQPLLPGDDGAWVEATRRDLAGVRGRALRVLAVACLRLGEPHDAARWAEQVIDLEPFHESAYRSLMEAHVAAGNRGEALQVYERCRRLLAEELGAYPSPETETAYRNLLQRASDQGPTAAVVDAPPIEVTPLAAAGRKRFPLLIGAATLAAAAAAATGLVLVGSRSGPPRALAGVDADSVGVLRPTTGRLVTQTPVRTGPHGVAAGAGALWVTNTDDDSVSRIDPKTNAVVQTIPVGNGPEGVAVGGGFVWVANSLDGTVSEIDPATDDVVAVRSVGNQPTGVAFGLGSAWVTNAADRTVVRIGATTGRLGRPVSLDAGADAVAVAYGSVWVTSGGSPGSVARIDPKTDAVVTVPVGNGPTAIAAGGGAVWIANSEDGTVSRIDPATNRQARVVQVGSGPAGVVVTGGAVWVANELGGTLSRIDPARATVVRTVETDNRPLGIAAASGSLFVAVRTYGRAHRGGTLTILSRPLTFAPNVDPADEFTPFPQQLLILTNDGLTGYKRVGGSDGTRLVPDLATSLPAPTDGGRTYTFQLRHGIRYSTGRSLRPGDFRRALERSLADPKGPGRLFFGGIVGAGACTTGHCDLSRGIATDNETNTVTFHLVAADPNFLWKLAQQSAYAVPSDTPLKAPLARPLPATGPYMVTRYDPKHEVRLVRNPSFREWSAAAQPAGFPDSIVWKVDNAKAAPVDEVRAVERGDGDLAYDGVPGSLLPGVGRRYAGEVHLHPTLETDFYAFNVRVPPFNDVRVRRAVNYAFDRRWFAARQSPPARPSCQVLPPGFAGYRRYCPYTRDPRPDGRYTGPDVAKAKRLVAASGTRGKAITVWAPARPDFGPATRYVVSLLRRLGYRARAHRTRSVGDLWVRLGPRNTIQLALVGGWLPDYPSPYDYFGLLLGCASLHVASNNNFGHFCSRAIDSEIGRANDLEATDPQRAAELWRQVDRDVVDAAPWLFLFNPRSVDFVSQRVGNYQYNPQWGALLDQLWVR